LAKLLAGPLPRVGGYFGMRTAGALTKSAVQAAIKAAMDAGMDVGRVEIENDKITILAGKSGELNGQVNANLNPWDEVLKDEVE
jgi:hypothetical protein